MTLYEINEQILSCIDEETGEVLDADKLNALQIEKDEKIENVALWIKDLKAEAEAMKTEKKSFEERQKACENKAESLKKWLADALNGEKFKTNKVLISFRKTKSVQVSDIWQVPEEYIKYGEPTPDKNAIKKAIEAGEDIHGAFLVENTSMTVK